MAQSTSSKTPLYVTLGVIAAVILGFVIYSAIPKGSGDTNATESDAARYAAEYKLAPEDNRFTYASEDDVLNTLDSGTGFVFLGFPECPWCQQISPILNEAATDADLDKIQYLNILQHRQDNDEVYQQLIEQLKPFLPTDEEGNPRISVPFVVAVKDGVKTPFVSPPTDGGEEVTPETYWTPERRAAGIEQLNTMIAGIK